MPFLTRDEEYLKQTILQREYPYFLKLSTQFYERFWTFQSSRNVVMSIAPRWVLSKNPHNYYQHHTLTRKEQTLHNHEKILRRQLPGTGGGVWGQTASWAQGFTLEWWECSGTTKVVAAQHSECMKCYWMSHFKMVTFTLMWNSPQQIIFFNSKKIHKSQYVLTTTAL